MLPTQTLILSTLERPDQFMGMIFPSDEVVFQPKLPSQRQLQQQQQQPGQLQLQQQHPSQLQPHLQQQQHEIQMHLQQQQQQIQMHLQQQQQQPGLLQHQQQQPGQLQQQHPSQLQPHLQQQQHQIQMHLQQQQQQPGLLQHQQQQPGQLQQQHPSQLQPHLQQQQHEMQMHLQQQKQQILMHLQQHQQQPGQLQHQQQTSQLQQQQQPSQLHLQGMPPTVNRGFVEFQSSIQTTAQQDQKPQGMLSAFGQAPAQSRFPAHGRPQILARDQQNQQHLQQNPQLQGTPLATEQAFTPSQFLHGRPRQQKTPGIASGFREPSLSSQLSNQTRPSPMSRGQQQQLDGMPSAMGEAFPRPWQGQDPPSMPGAGYQS